MTAQPIPAREDPDDPAEILRVLPERYHGRFRAEYDQALEQAHRPERYRALRDLLRCWRLRALAYGDPGYAGRLATVGEGRPDADLPAEQVISVWPSR